MIPEVTPMTPYISGPRRRATTSMATKARTLATVSPAARLRKLRVRRESGTGVELEVGSWEVPPSPDEAMPDVKPGALSQQANPERPGAGATDGVGLRAVRPEWRRRLFCHDFALATDRLAMDDLVQRARVLRREAKRFRARHAILEQRRPPRHLQRRDVVLPLAIGDLLDDAHSHCQDVEQVVIDAVDPFA